jgi:hypothetical protein
MSTTTVPPRDKTKHEYSIVPIKDGAHQGYQRVHVGQYALAAPGQGRAAVAARDLLADHDEYERVHIYHTYPSAGPVDRYVGFVDRDSLKALTTEGEPVTSGQNIPIHRPA